MIELLAILLAYYQAGDSVKQYVEDFETNTCLNCFPAEDYWGEWYLEGRENKPRIMVDPSNPENKVLDSDITRPAKPYNSNNSRSEPTWRPRKGPHPSPTWPEWRNFIPFFEKISFQFRFYIHKDWDWDSIHSVIIQQMKPAQGIATTNPNASLRIKDRHLELLMRWQPDSQLAVSEDTKEQAFFSSKSGDCFNCKFEVDSLKKETWYHVIIDVTVDYRNTAGNSPLGGGNGQYKVYFKEGGWPAASDLLFDHNDGTAYNTKKASGLGTYFKFGIYRWQWRHQKHIETDAAAGIDRSRILFDDVTIKQGHEFYIK